MFKFSLKICLILSLFIWSCEKDEPEKSNTPPAAFEVRASLQGTDVVLNWTESVDADGDEVTYAVVYGDTLAKGLLNRTYILKNIPYETEIKGTIVAQDGKGGKIESYFSIKTGENMYVDIPDVNFERFLITEGIDDVLDGKVLKMKIKARKSLSIGHNFEEQKIRNLTGLEYFENLQKLSVYELPIEKLDLSKNLLLEYLSLYDNLKLSSLNISKNINLEDVNITYSPLLTSLDIKDLRKLLKFVLYSSGIKDLDLTQNIDLKQLVLQNNSIESLNLLNNKKLTEILTFSNKLTSLDLTNNEQLALISVQESNLKTIRFPKNPENCTTLYLTYSPKVERIDLSILKNLSDLSLKANGMRNVDISNNVKLKEVSLGDNMLTNIDLSKNSELEYINVSDNMLTTFDLSHNLKLRTLNCKNNKIDNICIHKDMIPTNSWQKDSKTSYKVCD